MFIDTICKTLFTEASWIVSWIYLVQGTSAWKAYQNPYFFLVWPGTSGFSSWSKLSQSLNTLSWKQTQASADFSSSNEQFKTAQVWTKAGKLIDTEE